MTTDGNIIIYPGDKSQPTANLLIMVKPLFNSVILLTSEVRFMTIDIKNMYLIMSNIQLLKDAMEGKKPGSVRINGMSGWD